MSPGVLMPLIGKISASGARPPCPARHLQGGKPGEEHRQRQRQTRRLAALAQRRAGLSRYRVFFSTPAGKAAGGRGREALTCGNGLGRGSGAALTAARATAGPARRLRKGGAGCQANAH